MASPVRSHARERGPVDGGPFDARLLQSMIAHTKLVSKGIVDPMVGILTDTTACVPEKVLKTLGIEIVPYYVNRGKETLRDMVDVRPEEFADWLSTATTLPTTSNPGPGDYLAGLSRLATRVKEIVALTMTSKGSGAYQACRVGLDLFHEQFPDVRVEIVDTLQVAMSLGWSAIEAAQASLKGLPLEGVVQRARQVATTGMMLQTADTLRYLYMGGRIGKAKHLVGSLLSIRPLIGMNEGTIVALGTARSRPRAYRKMVELMRQRVGRGACIKIAYTHVAALDQVERLRSLVVNQFECVESIVTALSPALAVHSGPGTVGVSFFPV